MDSNVKSDLLNVKETAAKLGVSWRHVYRLSDAGAMPRPVKLGGAVRWRRQELEDWIEAGCPKLRSRGTR